MTEIDAHGLKAEDVVHLTITATAGGERRPKTGHLFTAKPGSHVRLWQPFGGPPSVLVVHPDDPPKLVHIDGTVEELTMKDGAIIMPVIVEARTPPVFAIGIANSDEIEWTQPPDAEKWS